jgi:hypothetical protein
MLIAKQFYLNITFLLQFHLTFSPESCKTAVTSLDFRDTYRKDEKYFESISFDFKKYIKKICNAFCTDSFWSYEIHKENNERHFAQLPFDFKKYIKKIMKDILHRFLFSYTRIKCNFLLLHGTSCLKGCNFINSEIFQKKITPLDRKFNFQQFSLWHVLSKNNRKVRFYGLNRTGAKYVLTQYTYKWYIVHLSV